jgi:hypothetical protein
MVTVVHGFQAESKDELETAVSDWCNNEASAKAKYDNLWQMYGGPSASVVGSFPESRALANNSPYAATSRSATPYSPNGGFSPNAKTTVSATPCLTTGGCAETSPYATAMVGSTPYAAAPLAPLAHIR